MSYKNYEPPSLGILSNLSLPRPSWAQIPPLNALFKKTLIIESPFIWGTEIHTITKVEKL